MQSKRNNTPGGKDHPPSAKRFHRSAICPPGKETELLLKELIDTPGNFAFPQAVQLISGYLSSMREGEETLPIRYRVNPNLSFPPSDVFQVTLPEEGDAASHAEMILNLMGLHGAGSPLPAYFTEYVAQHQDDLDPLRDFFDLFNHRLVEILYRTWGKYRYYIQFAPGASDKLSEHFFGFIGLGHRNIRAAKELNWSKLLPFMGLIAFKGDAAGSLESIMRHYFSHSEVSIVPCIIRRVHIPQDQQCDLAHANATLGTDCLLGELVSDQTGKFRLRIAGLKWERFNDFLPCNQIFTELQNLVKLVLRSRLNFDVELSLIPGEIRPLAIGESTVCRLGWSTWLGEDGDGIVILHTAV
jgi:type VI secretion system protein ImpH